MIISFFKLTLFLLFKWAEAALIYKAVIVRNLINQAAPMAIKNIETNVSKSITSIYLM